MKIIRSPKKMSALSLALKKKGKTIGFVPTMGALHKGHLSLMRRARKESDFLAVSIFVNPAQFSPSEDFKKYPRALSRDAKLCRKEGVDVIFTPSARDMYPDGFKTYVEVEDLSEVLCGKMRKGHFRGVTTVVTKLFNIVSPNVAYLGQKDAQQAVIIRKMVEDLNLPVKIKVMPIIRDKDGLALSSRNIYLSSEEREDALALSQSLKKAKAYIKSGVCDTGKVTKLISGVIRKKKTAKLDYVAVVDAEDLRPLKKIKRGSLVALAVRIGKTRLIDNVGIN